MFTAVQRHRHFFIVTAIILLVTTFPTILYVFRTDVFWLPERDHHDIYIQFWDIWYGKQILTGEADRLYTDAIFYPEGVSLVYHPVSLVRSAFVNLLLFFMPLSNAHCVAYLAIIYASALVAYLYLDWLFKDRWIALFGAIVFGFSAQTTGYPAWPLIAWIAPIPITVYCLHRGFVEKRSRLILLAGLLTVLSADTIAYQFVCAIMTICLLAFGMAMSRWRDKDFWRSILLLIAAIALACSWLVIPMLNDSDQLERADDYASFNTTNRDLMIFFVNSQHPILGPFATNLLQTHDDTKLNMRAYLGVIPLVLIGIGLLNPRRRRKMLPWLGILLVFLVLCLGSTLSINGTIVEGFRLPKYYLDRILPSVFAAFYTPQFFMTGAWLPLAVLSSYGLLALRDVGNFSVGPMSILLLVVIVAFEYYRPVYVNPASEVWSSDVTEKRVAYLDWLKSENTEEIRLVNLPFGRHASTRYSYFQSLSGYPQSEGAISRRPKSAHDFIRSNYLLRTWHDFSPVHCETSDREEYLAGLEELEQVGFTHIVFHRVYYGWDRIQASFAGIEPAYFDNYVSVYRINELGQTCPAELSARHHFTFALAGALRNTSLFYGRLGNTVVFPPAHEVSDHFMWYLRQFAHVDRTVITVSMDEQGEIDIQSSETHEPEPYISLEQSDALWLLNVTREFDADESATARDWFAMRYKFCQRFHEDGEIILDLYLKVALPCQAVDGRSAFEVEYDGGVKLHDLYIHRDEDTLSVFLNWSNQSTRRHSYSLQFFDQDGHKAQQYDEPIWDEPLSVREIDISELPEGLYSLQLVVYDFKTLASSAGALSATQHRFDREIEIAQVEVNA